MFDHILAELPLRFFEWYPLRLDPRTSGSYPDTLPSTLGESPMLATSATTSSMNLSVAAGKASARAVARRGGGTHPCLHGYIVLYRAI